LKSETVTPKRPNTNFPKNKKPIPTLKAVTIECRMTFDLSVLFISSVKPKKMGNTPITSMATKSDIKASKYSFMTQYEGGLVISRVLFPLFIGSRGHSSGQPVTWLLKRPTRDLRAGPPYPLHGLAPGGVCRALLSCERRRWALTPPFHPYPSHMAEAVCFLWHFPGVTPSGRYPAPCPLEPGLSSGAKSSSGHVTNPPIIILLL